MNSIRKPIIRVKHWHCGTMHRRADMFATIEHIPHKEFGSDRSALAWHTRQQRREIKDENGFNDARHALSGMLRQ